MRIFNLLIISALLALPIRAQVVINEASCRNFTQLTDTEGDNPDWIELYNAGSTVVNLWHYHLSDNPANPEKWTLPDIRLDAGKFLLIYASGKGRGSDGINHWETAVREDDTWRWINPDATTPLTWTTETFDDGTWNEGRGGFGYGDGDDVTEFPMQRVSVYTRIAFDISRKEDIAAVSLFVDYDDGFVAYLNGTEIARANMSTVAWNSLADVSREAIMYQGRLPEAFSLDMNRFGHLLHDGRNVLAIECHNYTNGLIDMSLRSFLLFGLTTPDSPYRPVPAWFKLDDGIDLATNFKISGKGETIYLTDNFGRPADQLELLPGLPVNSSMGCATDGSPMKAVFLQGTPGATNENQVAYTEGFQDTPVISVAGGFYHDPIVVTITDPSGSGQIRYTTDGQIPGPNSTPYTGAPLTISKSMVLKARCFSNSHKLPSQVVTNTYFIGETETPAAVLSITMEQKDLYGETGIYDNWGSDWKKQCHIEYFSPGEHRPLFSQYAGIRIDGGAGGSRANPQHSFRVEPGNGALGDGDLEYPLIGAKPDRKSYATFFLRNGSNQYLYYPCKDAIETRCMGDSTKNTYSGFAPIQVYLNGDYWGFYELREKIDEDYFLQHDGTDEDSLEILSVSYWYGGQLRAVKGKDPVTQFNDDYNKLLSLNVFNDNFQENADRYFDMEYYTDYICAQSFMADTDWPYNNIRIHRSPQTGNRWRFSLVDLEWSLAPNGWSDSNMDHIKFMLGYDPAYPYIHIWQKAMQNRRYHDYFINRYADLLNTAWKPDRLGRIANNVYDLTRPELSSNWKRWGDPNVAVSGYLSQFDDAQRTMLNEFNNRPMVVRNNLKSNFSLRKSVNITLDVAPAGAGTVRISTVTPGTYPWTGVYFDGIPVQVVATPNPGYVFTGWDQNNLVKDPSRAYFEDTLTRSAVFRARFREQAFSEKLVISEINYNSNPASDAGDWIEIWNRDKAMEASLNGWYFTDEDSTHVFRFSESAIIRPDERIILVNYAGRFAVAHPGVPFAGIFSFGLGAGGDAVKLFNYRREPVSVVVYDDQAPWPTGADGKGYTLELLDPDGNLSSGSNWIQGCKGGSPGRAYNNECSGTASAETVLAGDIRVYPVPARDRVTVEYPGVLPVTLALKNALGETVLLTTATGGRSEIALGDLPAGYYFIYIGWEDGRSQRIRISKI